jgi:hypothetical protein
MANTSISNLSAGAAVAATDVLPNVQTAGVGPVKTTALQLKTYMSASPTLVTPTLGIAVGTSLALGGATLGSNALAVTGLVNFASVGSSSAPTLSVGHQTTGFYSVSTTGFGIAVNGTLRYDYGITTASINTFVQGVTTGGNLTIGATSGHIWNGRAQMYSEATNNISLYGNGGAAGSFGLLQFSGTTSAYPALKRSTTILQVRLADDSAFGSMQAKLTTDAAYVGTPQVPTGYIVIYDSTGTAYKVSCNV